MTTRSESPVRMVDDACVAYWNDTGCSQFLAYVHPWTHDDIVAEVTRMIGRPAFPGAIELEVGLVHFEPTRAQAPGTVTIVGWRHVCGEEGRGDDAEN